jgi:RNA polymerase sigma factor (sigma-70 family)
VENDQLIWNDFKNGEKYALSHIYYQHVKQLYSYGRKFTRDEEIVKDTIQDLFFDLIRTRENLGNTDNIRFYLMKSFRRKLTLNLKKVLNLSDNHEPGLQITYSVEEDFIYQETVSKKEQRIQQGLKELAPKQREILYYRYTCELEYDQICEMMSLKYDSARKLTYRALQALKKYI